MKKTISLAAMLVLLGTAGLVYAQTTTTATSPTTTTSSSADATSSTGPSNPVITAATTPLPAMMGGGVPDVVQIGSDGSILIRGTVQSVDANSITISTWGGLWTIDTSAVTDFSPSMGLPAILDGDYVGVQGTVSQSDPLTVNATLVHDWTQTDAIPAPSVPLTIITTPNGGTTTPAIANNVSGTYTGKVNSAEGTTLTMLGPGAVFYTVDTTPTTNFTTMNSDSTNFAYIVAGDTVMVTGTLNGSTITASGVQDTTH